MPNCIDINLQIHSTEEYGVRSTLRQTLGQKLENAWYGKTGLTQVLRPLSWLFIALVTVRHFIYKSGLKKRIKLPVPVVIVGNLTAGGTGKTPLVIWLVNFLKSAGYKPGVISRGYSGRARNWPQQVRPDADPAMVGDEAVVIARRTGAPMAVGPSRVIDAKALLQHADVDIIISDDGLQHYALDRSIEIAVIDGVRRFGNGYCLPAGPLRELPARLESVDCKVTNGVAAQGEYTMKYRADKVINLLNNEVRALSDFKGMTVNAIAGIGNPDSFFNFLRGVGIRLHSRAFPDHYHYLQADLAFAADDTILMTEKDAVKCERFARENWWYIPLETALPDEFGVNILNLLGKRHG